jgi:hypothetical protein
LRLFRLFCIDLARMEIMTLLCFRNRTVWFVFKFFTDTWWHKTYVWTEKKQYEGREEKWEWESKRLSMIMRYIRNMYEIQLYINVQKRVCHAILSGYCHRILSICTKSHILVFAFNEKSPKSHLRDKQSMMICNFPLVWLNGCLLIELFSWETVRLLSKLFQQRNNNKSI